MWLRRSRRNCHFLPVSLFRETLPGLFLSLVSSYGEYEGAVRANIKGTYFPIVEIGMGVSNHTDEATNLHYKTNSPFFRVGLDYNILGDKISGNRVFAGGRLAYSSFKYDISGPNLKDPFGTTKFLTISKV